MQVIPDYAIKRFKHINYIDWIDSSSLSSHTWKGIEILNITHSGLNKMVDIFADIIFKSIFNFSWLKMFVFWLKFDWFVPNCTTNNKSALIKVIACYLTGHKPLPEPSLNKRWCHESLQGLNELKQLYTIMHAIWQPLLQLLSWYHLKPVKSHCNSFKNHLISITGTRSSN